MCEELREDPLYRPRDKVPRIACSSGVFRTLQSIYKFPRAFSLNFLGKNTACSLCLHGEKIRGFNYDHGYGEFLDGDYISE